MAADPTTLKVSPNTITQITAIKRNGTAITPITYNGMSGSSYSTFMISDFLSGDNVTFSSEGYSNLDVTIGTSEVVTFTEGYQTIAFYKHAGVTYEIEDEKARQDIATKQDALTTQTAYSAKGSATKVPQITTNNLGQVTNITEVTISQPTVNNKTITIQKNSTTVDSFTLNQSTDKTINISVPTKTSDLQNDSGFLTSHQSIKTLKTDNTTAQSTSSSEAIAGSGTINLHKVSKTGSYSDLLNKPTIPATNVIPATTTANKVLISTTTSGTAKWSDFSSAGFLKTNSSGVISVDTTSYGTYSKPSGGIPASDLAESYYLASNPNGYTSNAGTVTSVRVQAGTGLASSTSTAQSTTLNTTISIASGYKLPTTTEWSNKQDKLTAQTAYTSKGSATKVPQITTNTLGQVTGITEVDITQSTVNNSTITIQKNGTNVDSFTTNAASGKNINITLAKGDVGLGNVDNTADLDKPISNATQTALDAKQNTISDLGYIRNQVAKVDDKISAIDITDSGDSLPSAANYSVGDTFLNKTDKKLYTVLTPAYQLNTDTTVEGNVTVDLQTGIASGFVDSSSPGSAGSGVTRSGAAPGWTGQVQYNIHFKLTSLPSGSNYYCLFYLYGTYRFDFLISSTGFYVRYAHSSMGPTSYGDYVELFNYSDWVTNKEYFITIDKYSDNSVNTSLRETNYSGNILSQGSTTYNYSTGTEIGYGRRNGYYGSGTSFIIGQIYLADSTGDFLIPDGALTWDSGTTLEDNTQYNDTTNEKTIYYNNNIIYEGGSVAVDSSTITLNSSNQIQTVGYKDVRTNNTLKTWTGTKAQYDAIVTKDSNTLYNITDDTDTTAAMLELLYPVGAVYIGTMDVCPLATLGIGSWEKIASDQVLQGSSLNHNAGTTIAAGLPNITGSINRPGQNNTSGDSTTNYLTGSFYFDSSTYSRRNTSESGTGYLLKFDASRSNSIYGNSSTVQPPAFVVNIWRRIS